MRSGSASRTPNSSAVEKFCPPACQSPPGSWALGAVRLSACRAPRTLVNQKQQAGLRRDGHLRVIARGFEFLVPLRQRSVQFVGALQRRAQHRRAHAVKSAPARIQHQQPLRGKDLGIKLREGLGQGAARLVGRGQRIHGIGLAQQLPCLIQQRGNRSSSTMPPTGRAALCPADDPGVPPAG